VSERTLYATRLEIGNQCRDHRTVTMLHRIRSGHNTRSSIRRPKRGWFVGLVRSFKIDRFVISFLTQRQVPRSFNNLHKENNQETLGYCSGRSRLFKATICYVFNTES